MPRTLVGVSRWRAVAAATLLLLLGVVITALASRMKFLPPGLAPCWLACGLAVGPAVRRPWIRVLPAAALVALCGAWLGGELDWRAVAVSGICVAQVAAVAWGLRRALPRLLADRRPIYRVRLAHLSRFLFLITVPASLLAGALVLLLDVAAGAPLPVAARSGLSHAAATALSIAVIAPIFWWDGLRAIPWNVAATVAVTGVSLPLLAAEDWRVFWLAPVMVILAGHFGSTWTAVLAVASLASGMLFVMSSGRPSPFEGADAFLVWLLSTWPLLMAGLLASLWSDRRAALGRPSNQLDDIYATAEAAWRQWRIGVRRQCDWVILLLDDLLPDDGDTSGSALSPGSSLRVRGQLSRLATRFRFGDQVIGLGSNGAMVLLQVQDPLEPSRAELAQRCRLALHGGVVVARCVRATSTMVEFLLVSAVYLESEPKESPEARQSREPLPGQHQPLAESG